MIYLSGNVYFEESASDPLFNFPNKENQKIIKLERQVEIFDPINRIWEPLLLRGDIKILKIRKFPSKLSNDSKC